MVFFYSFSLINGKIKRMHITSSFSTPYCALITARQLAQACRGDSLLAAFASSAAKVFPYQVAAACFALRSPRQKGAVLCDEGSLGKTYEALLIAAQKWLEGRNKILIILPPNLLAQWQNKIEKDFALPVSLWRAGPVPQDEGLILTTYDFAVKNSSVLAQTAWDLVIFDEADCLFKPQNQSVQTLKAAFPRAFKLLLTPTPITLSIMDIYGLIHFIDEAVLPPEDEFYKRYFRKPEHYPELTALVSPFCFRTLKCQVSGYVSFTSRVPVTLDYPLTKVEKALYAQAEHYLKRPAKAAYPAMDPYELNLLFFHTLSSSPAAFAAMLEAPLSRTRGEEKEELRSLQLAARAITAPAKFAVLARTLKAAFKHLRTQKLPRKALVFVNNALTLQLLAQYLSNEKFRVLAYKNEKSIDLFRQGADEVLLTLDAAAKGLDMEFCPMVVNYDLLYNAIEMEQRICRCHRQGQTSDVLVVNLLSKENLADVRILELINKRTLQFDGIFGSSDDITGTFAQDIAPALPRVRPAKEAAAALAENLKINYPANVPILSRAEDMLFTTFSKAVADKVTLTPQYVEEKADALNARLWDLAKYFFSGREDYSVDEAAQTFTLTAAEPPVLFYYSSGGRSKPYTGKKIYALSKDFKPASARITFTSLLAKGLLDEIECPDEGVLTIPAAPEPCQIGFFRVQIRQKDQTVYEEDVLAGRTQSGQELSMADCEHILNLPARRVQTSPRVTSYWLKGLTGTAPQTDGLEKLIDAQKMVEKWRMSNQTKLADEMEGLKLNAARKKAQLEKSLYNLRIQTDCLRAQLAACTTEWEELQLQKKLSVAVRDLRKKEETLFLRRMEIDAALEAQLAAPPAVEEPDVKITPLFVVKVRQKDE